MTAATLNEEQQVAHDKIVGYIMGKDTSFAMWLLSGYAGTGKAQPIDAPVLTPFGYKAIGMLKVGEKVITATGSSTEVVGIYPQGMKRIAKVEFSDGTFTTCCYEHLWFTQSYDERNRDRASVNKTKVKGKSYKRSYGSVKTTADIAESITAREGDTLNHKIPITGAIEFAMTDPAVDGYLIGCLIGDGSLTTRNVSLSSADPEILKHIELPGGVSIAKSKDPMLYRFTSNKKRNPLTAALKEYGLFGCKSEHKFIPRRYQLASIGTRMRLLCGLMDTDGTCDKRGHNCSFSTSSKRLAEDFRFLVQTLGGIATINLKPTPKLMSYNVTVTLPSEVNPFMLTRKKARYIPKTKYIPARYITNVTDAGYADCVCIAVNHPSHLYLTEHCIVTHNTFTLTHIVHSVRKAPQEKTDDFEIFGGTRRLSIAMTAPTHKAVKVMKKFSRNLPGVHFATIHSLLGLKEQTDYNTGKKKFVQSKDPTQIKIETFDVVFIDESSMLPDELFVLLIPYVKRGLKLIFIGDKAQIPPVNHLDSKPFLEVERTKHNIGLVELSTIVRQALDNPILAYATRIRKAYQTASDFSVITHTIPDVDPLSGIVHVGEEDNQRIEEIIEKYFNCEEFRQDADHMKIVCWRNNTVDQFNRMVRRHIYKDQTNLPFIMRGEKLIVDEPVVLNSGRILLSTNEEIEVSDYSVEETTINYLVMQLVNREWVPDNPEATFKFYNTWVKYFDEEGIEQQANIRILHESENLRMQAVLGEIKKAATNVPQSTPWRGKLWQGFYGVDGKFAKVKYNYAITSHKSLTGSYHVNCWNALRA